MKVALLGTGAMGSAMARALARRDVPLTLWNRSADRVRALAKELGAQVAPTPAAAVAASELTITMLADRSAVDQVYLGRDGVLAAARSGLIACEMSTVEPAGQRDLAKRLRERGADLIDAPVSGSVGSAEQGELTLMVGGVQATLERARPVLEVLSARIFRMGEVGSGATMKLVVNSVVHSLNEAVAEALVLAERAGIDPARAYDVLESGAAAAPFVKYKRGAFLEPATAPVAFRLALARKDVQLILALASDVGLTLTQAQANLAVLDGAAARYGEQDMSALASYLREIADEPPADGPTRKDCL